MRIRKFPLRKSGFVLEKIGAVVNGLVTAEGHVELTALIESAKSVVPGPVQIVEKGHCFRGTGITLGQESVKAPSVGVVPRFGVRHRQGDNQSPSQPIIKVDQVWIDVIE